MGSYQPGTAVTLRGDFDLDGTPTDPTTVTLTVLLPDGDSVVYTYGDGDDLVRVSAGVYTLEFVPDQVGGYHYEWVGTGTVAVGMPGEFTVQPSYVEPPAPEPPGPVLGPCTAWIDAQDVVAAGCVPDSSDQMAWFETLALEASMALYEISGRKWSGLCTAVVRPCQNNCSCWGPASLGLGPWYWSSFASGWGVGAWGWQNEVGDRLGCKPMSRVRLAGYPVRDIVEVLIDGTVLDPVDEQGNPNYRLDEWRFLTRLDQPGAGPNPGGLPFQPRHWPGCQNLSLAPDQHGTFQVTYRWGVDPPQLGRDAAAAIACQLFQAAANQRCALPAGVTKTVRQGVTVERQLLANWLDPKKPTGIVSIDLFLRAYYETNKGRRAAVWSPDLQQFARPAGSYPSGS